jgi:hypothetical protein
MHDALDELYAKAMRDIHRQHAIALARQSLCIERLVASASIQRLDTPKKSRVGRPRRLTIKDASDLVWYFKLGVPKMELARIYRVSISTIRRYISIYS